MFARTRLHLPLIFAAALGAGAAPRVTYQPANTSIEAEGEPGNVLTIEASDQLQRPAWDLLGSVMLTNRTLRWNDPWCGNKSARFYRVTQSALRDFPWAEDFRLLDQEGKAHQLFYYGPSTDIQAFVLIFAANGCDEVKERLAAIQALRAKYESRGVLFWMVNSNPGETRASIAAEAAKLGINFPVLQDRAQTVLNVYRASKSGEVVCVSRDGFRIFYRGALDERDTVARGAAQRNFVDEALTAVLENRTPQVLQTKAAGCDVTNAPISEMSYSTAIAPLLQAKCVRCHSPGNVAPWAMTNHAIVQLYAPVIQQRVSAKEMPPWHADAEHGRFKNDLSLSPEQEKTLIQWILAGSPRGAGPDPLEIVPPPPPRWPLALGEPDLILRPPPQQIAANGVEPYRYIYVDTGFTEDKWLKAAIVKSTNPRVVHHYLVWEGKTMSQMASGLAGYVPGIQDLAFPEGTGVQLKAGSSVTFNLHYTPYGVAGTDQPELALWFHKTPPAKTLYTLPLVNQDFKIPPGAREFEVKAELPIPVPFNATLYGLAPHMHLRGARMKFDVIYPNGTAETLLSVPSYHFNWQTRYQLAEPKTIPQGTRIIVTGAFDNSTLNLANPDPDASVAWGEQSWDEMFMGYFEFTF